MTTKRSEDRDRADPIQVLVVEDMEFEVELASRQLQVSGIPHVMRRVDTEDAMRAALRDFNPRIILSDFSLPQFDGLRALEIAHECAPRIPFLFLSGTIGEERAIEALHRGAVDYVLKTNLARLGPAVRRALGEAETRSVRRQQEWQINRLTGVLRMLSGINGAAVRIRDRTELLREACRLAVNVGGYPTALVVLHQEKTRRLDPVACSGADPATVKALCALMERQMAKDLQGNNRALHTATPFTCNDEAANGTLVIGLPLIIDKTPVGVLGICTRHPGGLADEELRMLREVGANLAFALQYLRQDTKVRWLSYFDVLTGLAKRTLFCERLGRILRDSTDLRSRCAVAVLDVQNLSAINDSFGRYAGDMLLQLLADRLKRRFQDTRLLAHFSGGTFALVQPADGSSQARLHDLNEQLDRLFEEPFSLEGNDVLVAARSGIALRPDDGEDPDALVQKAEASLRDVKVTGQRRGHYNAKQHSEALARVALERKLHVALERRQYELHYQPKVSVKTRRIEGAEALIRWNDPDTGLVSPAAFLPILEETGLISEVGEWVVERAAMDCQQWQRMGLPPVRVAVNISPIQLRQTDFVRRFLKYTQCWATSSRGLDVEITESALDGDSSAEIGKLKMLRAAGVNIAIDDFGTGYSSLSRIANMPIDTLKIDRSFISAMTGDARSRRLVSIIVSIARAFKMRVVAEGVERQDQLDALWQLGCDQSQGYLHSKPLTAEHFAALLEQGNGRYILPGEPTMNLGRSAADAAASKVS